MQYSRIWRTFVFFLAGIPIGSQAHMVAVSQGGLLGNQIVVQQSPSNTRVITPQQVITGTKRSKVGIPCCVFQNSFFKCRITSFDVLRHLLYKAAVYPPFFSDTTVGLQPNLTWQIYYSDRYGTGSHLMTQSRGWYYVILRHVGSSF